MKRTINNFENWVTINEEGGAAGGGAGAGAAGGGTGAGVASGSGSGDASAGTTPVSTGGVAYFNQGSVDGMGAVKNSTVSPVPGSPKESEAGSGDVSLPAFTFTKDTGITGNKFHKMGKVKVDMGTIKKIKDKVGLGKVKSFEDFLNK